MCDSMAFLFTGTLCKAGELAGVLRGRKSPCYLLFLQRKTGKRQLNDVLLSVSLQGVTDRPIVQFFDYDTGSEGANGKANGNRQTHCSYFMELTCVYGVYRRRIMLNVDNECVKI